MILNDLHTHGVHLALLDVANTFPSVPSLMLTDLIKTADAPEPLLRFIGEVYQNTGGALARRASFLTHAPLVTF